MTVMSCKLKKLGFFMILALGTAQVIAIEQDCGPNDPTCSIPEAIANPSVLQRKASDEMQEAADTSEEPLLDDTFEEFKLAGSAAGDGVGKGEPSLTEVGLTQVHQDLVDQFAKLANQSLAEVGLEQDNQDVVDQIAKIGQAYDELQSLASAFVSVENMSEDDAGSYLHDHPTQMYDGKTLLTQSSTQQTWGRRRRRWIPRRRRRIFKAVVNAIAHPVKKLVSAVKQEVKDLKITAGPMDINVASGKVDVSPKFQVGVSSTSFSMTAGLGDLREGIHFGYSAAVQAVFSIEGSSLLQLLQNAQGKGIGGMAHGTYTRHIAWCALRATGFDISFKYMSGLLTVSKGVGTSYGIALGWANKDGFYMRGFHGPVCGKHGCITVKYFVGKHRTARKARLVLAAYSVEIDVVIWL